ncbi:MAG: GvpL/GvpF family gas vesicle protein [Verrucomicrobia bacterium]|nr:GvpL/GvpF family gas vesicle protein [Verrucomicrobiota bacterium]
MQQHDHKKSTCILHAGILNDARWMIYCILPTPSGVGTAPVQPAFAGAGSQSLRGVDEQPVFLVSARGLSAAASVVADRSGQPAIRQALAHQRVVQAFHRSETVVPMRYGCCFNAVRRIIRHIKQHRTAYDSLLRDLNGCVEMGIRCLLSGATTPDGQPSTTDSPLPASPKTESAVAVASANHPGRAFLEGRKTFYAVQDGLNGQIEDVRLQCQRLFDGIFVQCATESHFSPAPLFSLYFLVPALALKRFRRAFGLLRRSNSERFLLSGPWPPYNFAAIATGEIIPPRVH